MLHNKGLISILSAFILIIVMLIVVFALLMLNLQITENQQELGEYFIHFQKADDHQTFLNTCLNGFNDQTLDDALKMYDCIHPETAGYTIKIPPNPGITIKKWETGRNNNCEKKFAYIIDVFDPETNTTREGLLTICIGKRTYEPPKICTEEETRQCGTTDTGECEYGTETCNNNKWGNCIGAINPTNETCGNTDFDCDGKTTECPPQTGPCKPAEFCLKGWYPGNLLVKDGWPPACNLLYPGGSMPQTIPNPKGLIFWLLTDNRWDSSASCIINPDNPNCKSSQCMQGQGFCPGYETWNNPRNTNAWWRRNVDFFADSTTDCGYSAFFGNTDHNLGRVKFALDCKELNGRYCEALGNNVVPVDAYNAPLGATPSGTPASQFYRSAYKAYVHYKIQPGATKKQLGLICKYNLDEYWRPYDSTKLIADGQWHWTEDYQVCGIAAEPGNYTFWGVGNGTFAAGNYAGGSDRIEVDKIRIDICPTGAGENTNSALVNSLKGKFC